MSLSPAERLELRRVITVGNGKGGVFKTSLVANVGGLVAEAGYRTLLVDLDPQGNLGEDLGFTRRGDDGVAFHNAVLHQAELTPLVDVRPGLDVVTAGNLTYEAGRELDLRARADQDTAAAHRSAFARALAPLAPSYDIVLIDTPPSDRALLDLALMASRWVLIPTRSDDSSRKGLLQTGTYFSTARQLNDTLELLGVVLVGLGPRSVRIRQEAAASINADFADIGGAPLLQTVVRYVESPAVRARHNGQLVHELERAEAAAAQQRPWWEALRQGDKPTRVTSGGLAGDYQALAEEVLDRLSKEEARIAVEHGQEQR